MASVADTAFLVAALRARESARPDALFVDPFAERLAGEAGRLLLEAVGPRGEMAGWSVVLRTVLIDRFLMEAIERGTTTVINLGAGLDARPYRLALPPALVWVEIDQEVVIALKSERLRGDQPRCRLERVALDLLDVTARRVLLSRLLQGNPSALVLAEGVLPYFKEGDVSGILNDLRNCGAVQNLIAEYIPPAVAHAHNTRGGDGALAVPMRFAPANWAGFFAAHGWRVKEMVDLAQQGVQNGRVLAAHESTTLGASAACAVLEQA